MKDDFEIICWLDWDVKYNNINGISKNSRYYKEIGLSVFLNIYEYVYDDNLSKSRRKPITFYDTVNVDFQIKITTSITDFLFDYQ